MNLDLHRVSLQPEHSIRAALETINREASRVVLVVNTKQQLLGLVTDGDIRRGILRGVSLHSPLSHIMNAEPLTFPEETPLDTIREQLMQRQLLHAPLLDSQNRLTGLVCLHDVIEKPRHDNPVFLMAGGFGRRLMPLTKDCPKPLLKVGNKPLLETTLENFIEAGFHRFYISTHYLSNMVKDHFGDGGRWQVSIEYIHEDQPLGTAGALGLLGAMEQDLPLIVMNGDILTKVDFEQLIRYHNRQQDALATMCVRECQYQIPYGVVDTDGEQVLSMQEKPCQRFLVNAGIYVVTPQLVQQIDKNQHIDMPTLLSKQLHENRKVAMFPIHEYWLDIGKQDDFQRAQHEFADEFASA